jgi:hypothetical protein
LLDRAVGRLEADLAVRAIAEWPVGAPCTSAKGKGNLACEVVSIAVSIDDFNQTIRIVDPEWTVPADSNRNLRHEASG